MEPRYDVIVRNGTVIDGTGRPGFVGDVAIAGERLVAVGELGPGAGARREFDASGLIVAPGFIDVHTHDDAMILSRPEMTPKLSQGVTTVICGNCGVSGAPYSRPEGPLDLMHLIFKTAELAAPTLAQFLAKVEAAGPAINAAFLTGHTTLRMEVMGSDLQRPATGAEIAAMRVLLEQCLQEGSLGLSTGLFYMAARSAPTAEVIELAQPLKCHGGLYVTHMRDEGDHVLESIRETMRIGREVQAPVIVSHHKCLGSRNFGRSTQTLALFDEARRAQCLAFDVYPYTAASTVLNEEMVAIASKTLVSWSDAYPEFGGQDLEEIVARWNCSRAVAIARLQPAGGTYFMMDETDVQRIMRHPAAMIGSDGLPDDKHPHPRLWGTFPRVLGRYVRERAVLGLEEAVHRMSGLSAREFGLRGRGEIAVDSFADLTVFDASTVLDTATFEQPISAAAGIHHVFVNGQLAWSEGAAVERHAGKVLRRSRVSQ